MVDFSPSIALGRLRHFSPTYGELALLEQVRELRTRLALECLAIWRIAGSAHDLIKCFRLFAMLSDGSFKVSGDIINARAQVSARTKQDMLSRVAKIGTESPPRLAVLTEFAPSENRSMLEAPPRHQVDGARHEVVGRP